LGGQTTRPAIPWDVEGPRLRGALGLGGVVVRPHAGWGKRKLTLQRWAKRGKPSLRVEIQSEETAKYGGGTLRGSTRRRVDRGVEIYQVLAESSWGKKGKKAQQHMG